MRDAIRVGWFDADESRPFPGGLIDLDLWAARVSGPIADDWPANLAEPGSRVATAGVSGRFVGFAVVTAGGGSGPRLVTIVEAPVARGLGVVAALASAVVDEAGDETIDAVLPDDHALTWRLRAAGWKVDGPRLIAPRHPPADSPDAMLPL
jgi:hypothetical protein